MSLSGGNTAVTEKAAANGQDGANAAMAYGTDGNLAALDLVVLKDPKGVQPVYQPAPTFRADVVTKYPEIPAASSIRCSQSLTTETLQSLNAKIAVDGQDAEEGRDRLPDREGLPQVGRGRLAGPRARRMVDEVALTGAVAALVGCLGLPLAVLRSSRLALRRRAARRSSRRARWGVAVVALAPSRALARRVRASARRRAGVLALARTPPRSSVALAFALGASASRLLAAAPADRARVAGRAASGSRSPAAPRSRPPVARDGGAARGRARRGSRWRSSRPCSPGGPRPCAVGGLAHVAIAREYARAARGLPPAARAASRARRRRARGRARHRRARSASLAARDRRVRDVALGVTGILETIPSLALLGLLIAPLAALAPRTPRSRPPA